MLKRSIIYNSIILFKKKKNFMKNKFRINKFIERSFSILKLFQMHILNNSTKPSFKFQM